MQDGDLVKAVQSHMCIHYSLLLVPLHLPQHLRASLQSRYSKASGTLHTSLHHAPFLHSAGTCELHQLLFRHNPDVKVGPSQL